MIRTAKTTGGIVRGATTLVVLAGLSGCAFGPPPPSYPVPEEPGLYAFTSKKDVRRIDGDAEWEAETWPERSSLPSNVHFVINEPALAGRSPGTSIELWRVAWVRSDINERNQAMPVAGAEWAVAPIEPFRVPFRYESPADQPEIVHIVPDGPLTPGLYTLRIANPATRQARIGVAWGSLDKRQYSAANCVDRYVAEGNVYRTCTTAVGAQGAIAPAGNVAGYDPAVSATSGGGVTSLSALPAPQPAPQPTTAAINPGLQIALVDPVRRGDGLLIQGVVINTTGQPQLVPTMQATLKNAAGQELRRWVFNAPVRQLAPGERANFKTEVRPVPQGVARANVAFIAGAVQ